MKKIKKVNTPKTIKRERKIAVHTQIVLCG
jgi:hypothetical protein